MTLTILSFVLVTISRSGLLVLYCTIAYTPIVYSQSDHLRFAFLVEVASLRSFAFSWLHLFFSDFTVLFFLSECGSIAVEYPTVVVITCVSRVGFVRLMRLRRLSCIIQLDYCLGRPYGMLSY